MSELRRWLLPVVGLGIAAAGLWIVINSLGDVRLIDAYSPVDDDTILIHSSAGQGAWTRVTDVTETSDRVTVTVKSFHFSLGYSASVAYPLSLTVELATRLGDRRVFDAHHEVPAAP